METTKNELPPYASLFFDKLGKYLDTKIYYFGSVQRSDYFPQSSDIDVDIFTDNESSTIAKIQNFLGVNRYEFKKFIYRLHKSNKLVHGYKIKHNDFKNHFKTDMSIYNKKDKKEVILEHTSKFVLPLYISILLIILKYIYYNIGIIPTNTYIYMKNIIIDNMVEGKSSEFVTTEIPKHKD
jgi:predicted nucleotidyltransferase